MPMLLQFQMLLLKRRLQPPPQRVLMLVLQSAQSVQRLHRPLFRRP